MDRRQRDDERSVRQASCLSALMVRTQSGRGYPRACPTCGIVRPLQNVATWTVLLGQTSVGWVPGCPRKTNLRSRVLFRARRFRNLSGD
ncbi:hypothetical protein MTO96_013097 [Rhipicephalus appendiculatus]